MQTVFGTLFCAALGSALEPYGWVRRPGTLAWTCGTTTAALLTGRTVKVTRRGVPGQRLATSRKHDPCAAAAEVAGQVLAVRREHEAIEGALEMEGSSDV